MNCQNCNQPVPDGANYCPKCGSKIDIITEIVSIEPTTFPLNTDGLWLTSKDLTYRCKAKRSKGTLLYSEISKCEKRNFASWFMLDITTTENRNICLNIKKKDEAKLDQAVEYIKEHCAGVSIPKPSVTIDKADKRDANKPATTTANAKLHLRGLPDKNGLYPSELVMLAVAEKYKVNEGHYPGYLTYNYEIANPEKMLRDLQSRGYVTVASASDSLNNLTVSELKEIASALEVSKTGKKAEIIARLADHGDEALETHVKDRTWKLTDEGVAALNNNPYVQYFLDKHAYNITEVGVDIWAINKICVEHPKMRYRDAIWGELNRQTIEAAKGFGNGSYSTYKYCQIHRIMALFMEEEGKLYLDAAKNYFIYLYDWINLHEGRNLIYQYHLINDKVYREKLIQEYYEEIKLYPFQRQELLSLIDKLNMSESDLRYHMIKAFTRSKNVVIMDPVGAADFISYEMSGEIAKSKKLAIELATRAVKRKK